MVLCQVCDILYLTENLKNKVYFKSGQMHQDYLTQDIKF